MKTPGNLRCRSCGMPEQEGTLYVTGYDPLKLDCGTCVRETMFRYRLALNNIAGRKCECVLPGCMHAIAIDALKDR